MEGGGQVRGREEAEEGCAGIQFATTGGEFQIPGGQTQCILQR